MNKTSKRAIIATATAVFAGIVGTAVYRASVHEQICVSYERQLLAKAVVGSGILDQLLVMKSTIEENPFSVLGYLNQIGTITQQANEFKPDMNNTFYAYIGTCGEKRKSDWVARPQVKSVFEEIESKAGQL